MSFLYRLSSTIQCRAGIMPWPKFTTPDSKPKGITWLTNMLLQSDMIQNFCNFLWKDCILHESKNLTISHRSCNYTLEMVFLYPSLSRSLPRSILNWYLFEKDTNRTHFVFFTGGMITRSSKETLALVLHVESRLCFMVNVELIVEIQIK